MYKLICMSFDGEFKTEPREAVESIDLAWEVSGDMGSRWFFYPFHFVVTESGKTIADAPNELNRFIGRRVKTVVNEFAHAASLPEAINADVDEFLSIIS